MWLSSILNSLRPSSPDTRARRRPSPRRRPAGHRLTVEALEDRALLSYTFTPIADTGPDSPYRTLAVGQAVNDLGQVAFVADLRAGGQAVYRTEVDGRLTTIARTDALIRDFYLSPYMNTGGTVSFGANLTDGRQAVFTGSGGALTRIADTGPDSPFGSIPNPAQRMDEDGVVYFRATLRSGPTGFFAGDGGPTETVYSTGGQFSAFPSSFAHQVSGGGGSFRATLTGGPEGVFFGDGRQTDTLVTAGGTYGSFFGAECNDAGTVAISANLAAGGQVLLVARGGTLTPFADTTGPYLQIIGGGEVSINNGGAIAFGAALRAGGRGFFEGSDPAADKIIAVGDVLSGSAVVAFPTNAMNPRGLNNAGQFLFRADLADGRRVLVRADRDCETVESVVLNDGSAQRSMVTSLTVTFAGAAVLDPGAIELRRQDGSLVDSDVDISVVGGKTVAVLTFEGPEFVGGSLADGGYILTVRADRVHDRWGRELDGGGDGLPGGDRVDAFSRLFGDSDGDRDLDQLDRDLFRPAFGTGATDAGYLWYFDFDGDGDVDGLDNGEFNRRFGQS
jgi:hypothetical protein